jgi:HPt (histidine-containing phosphotransfer) domain-containing protein
MPEAAAAPALKLQWMRELTAELDDPLPALTFLAGYLAMLPARTERISLELQAHDAGAAMNALASLKTASSMAGALRTEAFCGAIEPHINNHRFDNALDAAADLAQHAAALIEAAPVLLAEARTALTNAGS